ncbi:MAG: MFS transporter [Eubacteriales bacterium]
MMMNDSAPKKKISIEIILYMILISFVALGNGFSDSIYSNYFKEVFDITATQRGFIEFPRELPGLLCAVVIALLSSLGDLRTAFIAQIFAFIGLLALGILTPGYGFMLILLFINSMGMHLFMPLQDGIGMSLAEPDKIGNRMGQYASIRSVFSFIAGLLVFFGFRFGFFSFQTDIILVFIIGAIAFACAIIASTLLIYRIKPSKSARKKVKLVFRKEYKYYYLLTTLHGVQKQIAYVYGSWVLVDLLLKGADTMSLLIICSSFICIFFMRYLGKWIDQLGIRKMMFVDALSFIVIYVIYGFVVWGITSDELPSTGLSVFIVYLLFILDRLSMQIGMVKSVYLKSIAVNPEEVTSTLSTGTSLDHVVSIIAAAIGGVIWSTFGSHYVFFMAAAFSLGNLYVAFQIKDKA